ncbi:MAG: hypothetical protein ACR2KK_12175 [Acidimicrobiales bacterium]
MTAPDLGPLPGRGRDDDVGEDVGQPLAGRQPVDAEPAEAGGDPWATLAVRLLAGDDRELPAPTTPIPGGFDTDATTPHHGPEAGLA